MSHFNQEAEASHHERPNFVSTCNLLSQYVKQGGSLRDLNLEIGGKVESFEALVKSLGSPQNVAPAPPTNTTMNGLNKDKGKSVVQQQPPAPFTMPAPDKLTTRKDESKEEPKTGQLTIFYGGRMLTFEDYEAGKVRQLVSMAKKGSSKFSYGIFSNTLQAKSDPGTASVSLTSSVPTTGLPPRPPPSRAALSSGSHVAESSNTDQERGVSPQPPEANVSDLPIARRSSLHRFLGKRKDRAAARGAYEVHEEVEASSCKDDEQLELKL